jgi:hypothetical protein
VAPESARILYVLASKDWDCSFKITELPTNKSTAMETGTKMVVTYKKLRNRKIRHCSEVCKARA